MSEAIVKQIQQVIRRMRSLSTTVAKVLEICNNPTSSANDLNRVISYDPVLTAHALKLINSAFYGLPNRIPSLARAIIMLGINTVKNLVLASSVMAVCKGISKTENVTSDDYWAHCLCKVGGLIAYRNLGSAMRDAVMKHHDLTFTDTGNPMAKCVGTANLLANQFEIGTVGDFFMNPMLLKHCLDGLGLSMEILSILKSKMESEIEKASIFLQIDEMGTRS